MGKARKRRAAARQRAERKTRSRWVAVVAIAGVLALVWLLLHRHNSPDRAVAGATHADPKGDRPNANGGNHRGRRPALDMSDPKAPGKRPLRNHLTPEEIKHFRKWRVKALQKLRRYPGSSEPLAQRHIDALTKVEPDEARARRSDHEEPDKAKDVLLAYPAKKFFQDEEPVVLHAGLYRAVRSDTTNGEELSAGATARTAFGVRDAADSAERNARARQALVLTANRIHQLAGTPGSQAGRRRFESVILLCTYRPVN